jgi:hypothetical protein
MSLLSSRHHHHRQQHTAFHSDDEEVDEEGEERAAQVGNSEQREETLLPLPSGRFAYTSHVKIYATCRLRRIWFTQERVKSDALDDGGTGGVPWEMQLYADA